MPTEDEPLFKLFYILNWGVFVLTVGAFIYGVTSWCIIKKFRNFKNYVYLNAILANVCSFTVFFIGYHVVYGGIFENGWDAILFAAISFIIFVYFKTVYNYWLLVMCYIFYVDIVKVFNTEIQKKYLKSSLFAWALPFVFALLCILQFLFDIIPSVIHDRYSDEDYFRLLLVVSLVIPLTINLFLYIRIVSSLFRCGNASMSSATDNWRRLYMATLMFVMSDLIMVSGYVLYFYFAKTRFTTEILIIVDILLYSLNSIALDVFVVAVKSNRELWHEYFVNSSRLRSLSLTNLEPAGGRVASS